MKKCPYSLLTEWQNSIKSWNNDCALFNFTSFFFMTLLSIGKGCVYGSFIAFISSLFASYIIIILFILGITFVDANGTYKIMVMDYKETGEVYY